ncbi:MAG: hypothetical protein J7K68_04745 [Candidatus Diapherotrites archaeon]|nr:hypothetical protein [Candidatus Diapherotrites archaeon]
MNLEYDKDDNLFRLDGKELFWSSMYLLSRKKISIPEAIKKLRVSKDELDIFHEELNDLYKMGLIHKDFSKYIRATKKGLEVVKKAKKIADFSNLEKKAIRDIDRVEYSVEELLKMDEKETKPLLPRGRRLDERFNWAPFYLNVLTGSFVFFILTTVFYYGYNWQGWNIFITWMVASPLLAVFFSAVAVGFVAIMFHGGKAINDTLFRR